MLALIFRRFLNLLGYGENSAIATADRRRFFDKDPQKRHIFEAVSGVSAIATRGGDSNGDRADPSIRPDIGQRY
ncbi:MAG: hypothetical protein D6680_16050 [Cyanobacteria bacterium J007]|nr:MAG: hypothetical protein D6680_16050 [Cyanobacteria bacterium J007]